MRKLLPVMKRFRWVSRGNADAALVEWTQTGLRWAPATQTVLEVSARWTDVHIKAAAEEAAAGSSTFWHLVKYSSAAQTRLILKVQSKNRNFVAAFKDVLEISLSGIGFELFWLSLYWRLKSWRRINKNHFCFQTLVFDFKVKISEKQKI